MRTPIFVLLLLGSLAACNTGSKKDGQGQRSDSGRPDSHTSEIALDWAGVYEGTLPCADCEGIETEIELKKDKTYTLTQHYLGKSDSIYRETGQFEWNDDGGAIALQIPNEVPEHHQYKVVENGLVKLDKTGSTILGKLSKFYRLEKKDMEK